MTFSELYSKENQAAMDAICVAMFKLGIKSIDLGDKTAAVGANELHIEPEIKFYESEE